MRFFFYCLKIFFRNIRRGISLSLYNHLFNEQIVNNERNDNNGNFLYVVHRIFFFGFDVDNKFLKINLDGSTTFLYLRK